MRKTSVAVVALAAVSRIAWAQPAPTRLTLQEASALALKNHPHVLAAQAETGVAEQQIVEARAPYYPTVNAALTGSQGNDQARVGAGAIAASRLFTRFGQGLILSQLVTDFSRTSNLVASSRLQQQASTQDLAATRYDVLLAVNRGFFEVLRTQAAVKVAEETVAARQLLLDQVSVLAKNNLKSQLDVSFADVTVSEAKLLLIRANDGVQESLAELARALGSDQPANYQPVDEPLPPSPPSKPDDLVAQAFAARPELASLRYTRDAAYRFAEAEKDLKRPIVSVVGVAGALPLINQPATGAQVPPGYEGAALNVDIPVFNGHLFTAREEAARLRAAQSDQRLRDEQERVARDVRVAWASAMTAYQRIDVTAQFLRQAALALDLAKGRFDLGLSSIVELTQAQLNVTSAELENLNAKYDYHVQYAVLQYALGQLR